MANTPTPEEVLALIKKRMNDRKVNRQSVGVLHLASAANTISLPTHQAGGDVGLSHYVEDIEGNRKSYILPVDEEKEQQSLASPSPVTKENQWLAQITNEEKDLHLATSPQDADANFGVLSASPVEEMYLSLVSSNAHKGKDQQRRSAGNKAKSAHGRSKDAIRQEQLERAKRGLPEIASLTWLKVQMWDNGVARGRTRYNVKLTATDKEPRFIDRKEGNIERFAAMSTLKQFKANTSRKKDMNTDERRIVDQCISLAHEINICRSAGEPEALIGFVSLKFRGLGTHRYPGQLIIIQWNKNEDSWEPTAYIIHGEDHISVVLPYRADIDGRDEDASDWCGSFYSKAYCDYLDEMRRRKSEREQRRAA